MLIRKLRPSEGIRFAWFPVMTPEGEVWFEHVHYRWIDTGFGGGYQYERVTYMRDEPFDTLMVDYSKCSWIAERTEMERQRAATEVRAFWKTPGFTGPNAPAYCPEWCGQRKIGFKLRMPCAYPKCDCMLEGGRDTCGG